MRHFLIRSATRYATLPACVLLAGLATPARAAYVANVMEVGNNVVATGSGTINTAALTFEPSQDGGDYDTGYSFSLAGDFGVGPATDTLIDKYTGYTGPLAFGAGDHSVNADSGSGNMVEVGAYFNAMDVPAGYVSNSPLSDTSTFDNQTFASMGLAPGVYQWTWGAGATADSYTLNIGAVPEPCSTGLIALAGMFLLGRRKRRA